MSINWDTIPGGVFKCKEFDDPNFPGSGNIIDPVLLEMMIRLRLHTGWPIITMAKVGGAVDVDSGWGHAINSYHLKKMGCKALDWFFLTEAPECEQYHAVSQIGFGGIGIYRDWHWAGKFLPIGFHTDIRPVEITQRWKRINGEYVYLL